MKKRRAPLFADQEPATYVMDSSAWFDIDTLSNVREAWAVVIALITAGRLFAPVEVLDELRSDDDLWPRIQPYEGKLRGGARNDETYLLLAGRIAHAYPSLAGLRSRVKQKQIHL